jgi:hypothetical protein
MTITSTAPRPLDIFTGGIVVNGCTVTNRGGRGLISVEWATGTSPTPPLSTGTAPIFASGGNSLATTAFNSAARWESGVVSGTSDARVRAILGVKDYASPDLAIGPTVANFGWQLQRDTSDSLRGMFCSVNEGFANKGRTFALTSPDPITVGTTPLRFGEMSVIAGDKWDFAWSAEAGSPTVLGNWSNSAAIASVQKIGVGGTLASAPALHEGVLSWALTTSAIAEREELIIVPKVPSDSWELRARVWLPGKDGQGSAFVIGACGKFLESLSPQMGPEFLAAATAAGACLQLGAATEKLKQETANVMETWITVTIRATRVQRPGTLPARRDFMFTLWCGEVFMGSWNGNVDVSLNTLTPGMIRFGRISGKAVRTVRVASIAWRAGTNQALPSHTLRGQGIDSGTDLPL